MWHFKRQWNTYTGRGRTFSSIGSSMLWDSAWLLLLDSCWTLAAGLKQTECAEHQIMSQCKIILQTGKWWDPTAESYLGRGEWGTLCQVFFRKLSSAGTSLLQCKLCSFLLETVRYYQLSKQKHTCDRVCKNLKCLFLQRKRNFSEENKTLAGD